MDEYIEVTLGPPDLLLLPHRERSRVRLRPRGDLDLDGFFHSYSPEPLQFRRVPDYATLTLHCGQVVLMLKNPLVWVTWPRTLASRVRCRERSRLARSRAFAAVLQFIELYVASKAESRLRK